MMNPPLFVQLGDDQINLAYVHLMRVIPDKSARIGRSVSIDMGTRTWVWQPKTEAELAWLAKAAGVLQPGTLPRELGAAPLTAMLEARRAPARKG